MKKEHGFLRFILRLQYHETLVNSYLVNLVRINFKISIKVPGGTRDMKIEHGFLCFRLRLQINECIVFGELVRFPLSPVIAFVGCDGPLPTFFLPIMFIVCKCDFLINILLYTVINQSIRWNIINIKKHSNDRQNNNGQTYILNYANRQNIRKHEIPHVYRIENTCFKCSACTCDAWVE